MPITSLKFGLISPEWIKKMAVKEITRAEVYDADGYPVEGGVMDPALGVIDPGMICPTDGAGIKDCNGYFGFIELARPVIHVLYTKTIKKLLNAACGECGDSVWDGKGKFSRGSSCPHCKKLLDKIKLEKPYSFFEGKRYLPPDEVRRRLEGLPDEIVEKLGFGGGRPEWLILTRFLVPPVTIRPSITLETGERSEDDLTHKLVDLIRINQRLKNNIEIGAPEFIIEDLWELLQYHVSTAFDNTITGIPPARHRSGRSLKSLIERLSGKDGRFRQNLIGKRANFSARTVVSPDPNIAIDEVGVPYLIAQELTVPVKVTARNIDQARMWLKNASKYPGANYIIRPDGARKRVTDQTSEELMYEVVPGYTVERHLIDGDVVLFNRQPSLHRMSIMAHRVRVMPYRTFRLNLCVCSPYNADFDGDEMNLHVPQTEEAQAEARELLKVENHLKSPKTGGPIIGLIQDHISGLYLLSRAEKIPREDIVDLMVAIQEYDVAVPKKDYLSGMEVISIFLPKEISFTSRAANGMELKIEKGIMKSGVLDKSAVGENGELINRIMMDVGRDAAVDFLNTFSRLGITYLERNGFSMGVSDLEIDVKAQRLIDKAVEAGQKKAMEYVRDFEEGRLERIPGKSRNETLEILLTQTLRGISTEAEGIIKEFTPQTSARIMMESGARGSMTNLALMIGLMGQETIRGGRISRGFKKRTTSHFRPGDLTPKARGFVRSSITGGLDPIESFYEVMSQREGLMDTSLRTRTSGYMYRRVSNALQDLRVEYDLTVRMADGKIVQFVAGEDGIDPSKSDRGEVVHGK